MYSYYQNIYKQLSDYVNNEIGCGERVFGIINVLVACRKRVSLVLWDPEECTGLDSEKYLLLTVCRGAPSCTAWPCHLGTGYARLCCGRHHRRFRRAEQQTGDLTRWAPPPR